MRFLLLLTVFGAGTLLADPVLSLPSTINNANSFDQTIGFEFNVLSSITVTGVGWFDQNADGLQLAHEVGIWNATGTLLTSATVAQGTTDPLDGQFRTAAVTPIVLAPGEYIVGGQNFATNTEQVVFGVTPTTDSKIAFVQGEASKSDNTFEFPDIPTGKNSLCCFGPSFSVDSSTVPEPAGSSLFLATGILAMLFARRRRRA